MATLREVAEAAGVSISTVSRVVNGYEHVSEEVRRRVLQAIEELNYEPNLLAKALVRGRDTKQIGLLVHDVANTYFAEIASAVENVAFQHGYSVILCNSSHGRSINTYLDTFWQRKVDGVAIATGELNEQHIRRLERLVERDIPIVISRERGWPSNALFEHIQDKIGFIELDFYSGAKIAMEYLISLGHERIAYLCSLPPSISERDPRTFGYREALAENGLPLDENLIVYDIGYGTAAGARGMFELLARGVDFTAVLAYNDLVAIGAMGACREEGLDIPGDVSVIGFDNIETSKYIYPLLTTVHVPKGEQGELMATYLLSQIREKHGALHHRYSMELIVRRSTGTAKKRKPSKTS